MRNYWYLAPAIVLYQVSVLIRTLRWHSLLKPMRQRIGELVRSYYVGGREGVSKTSALVTIIVVLGTLVSDILLAVVDPRIKYTNG